MTQRWKYFFPLEKSLQSPRGNEIPSNGTSSSSSSEKSSGSVDVSIPPAFPHSPIPDSLFDDLTTLDNYLIEQELGLGQKNNDKNTIESRVQPSDNHVVPAIQTDKRQIFMPHLNGYRVKVEADINNGKVHEYNNINSLSSIGMNGAFQRPPHTTIHKPFPANLTPNINLFNGGTIGPPWAARTRPPLIENGPRIASYNSMSPYTVPYQILSSQQYSSQSQHLASQNMQSHQRRYNSIS